VATRALVIHTASTSSLIKVLIHANAHNKKPKTGYNLPGKPGYTAAGYKELVSDIHSLRNGYVPIAILSAAIILLLIFALRKPRSASGSRWVLVVAMIFPTSILLGAVSPFGFPGAAQVAGVAMTVGAVAAIVLVFSPASTAYVRACKEAATPPELRGVPRQRLFGPRPAPAARPGQVRTGARPTARQAAAAASSNSGRAKAKARSDAEATARGAELARARARASKSRRTDV
jgi:hypothetical protein